MYYTEFHIMGISSAPFVDNSITTDLFSGSACASKWAIRKKINMMESTMKI